MTTTVRGALYGLTAAALWGGMYVVSDVVLETIPPFTLLTIRIVMAVAVLLALLRGKLPPMTRHQVITLLAVGVVGYGISVAAQYVGTDLSTAVNGALITSASPAFILLFAALLLRERLTMQRLAAVILATIGVVVIIGPSAASFGSQTFGGDVALALAAITWGLYSVLVRRVSAWMDTLTISVMVMSGGLIITLPASVLELAQNPVGEITPAILLALVYLGVITMAGANWLWNRAFALVDASAASLFFFAQPLVGAALGIALLDQPFTAQIALGSLCIAAGVLLALIPRRYRLPEAARSS